MHLKRVHPQFHFPWHFVSRDPDNDRFELWLEEDEAGEVLVEDVDQVLVQPRSSLLKGRDGGLAVNDFGCL